MQRKVRSFLGLLYFYTLAYVVRSPSSIPMLVFRMLVFVLLLILVGGSNYLVHALSGVIVALAFGAGLSQFSVDINALRTTMFRYMLYNTLLGPLSFAVGSALGMSLLSFIGITVFLIPWCYVCKPSFLGMLELVLVLGATWLCGLLLGFVLSVVIKTPHTLFNITETVYALLVYLAPVYYPITILPNELRPLAYLSPATHAGILVREIALKGQIVSWPHLYILALVDVLLAVIVLRLSTWKEV